MLSKLVSRTRKMWASVTRAFFRLLNSMIIIVYYNLFSKSIVGIINYLYIDSILLKVIQLHFLYPIINCQTTHICWYYSIKDESNCPLSACIRLRALWKANTTDKTFCFMESTDGLAILYLSRVIWSQPLVLWNTRLSESAIKQSRLLGLNDHI